MTDGCSVRVCRLCSYIEQVQLFHTPWELNAYLGGKVCVSILLDEEGVDDGLKKHVVISLYGWFYLWYGELDVRLGYHGVKCALGAWFL